MNKNKKREMEVNCLRCFPTKASMTTALQILKDATEFNLEYMIALALDEAKKLTKSEFRDAQQKQIAEMQEDILNLEIKNKELAINYNVAKIALQELSLLGGGRSDGNQIAKEALLNLTK
jgi:hypothetical protein